MALSPKVKEEILEAQSHLRAALKNAAVNEKTFVCKQIAEILYTVDSIELIDTITDKLENRKFGDSGSFGSFFSGS
jgi:hypothetical protein